MELDVAGSWTLREGNVVQGLQVATLAAGTVSDLIDARTCVRVLYGFDWFFMSIGPQWILSPKHMCFLV